MKSYFVRSFRYTAWANEQTLASLRDCPAAHSESLPLLAHLFSAEHIWLSRLLKNEPTLPVWSALSFDDCQKLAAENARGWTNYFASTADDDLCHDLEYRNSRGELFLNSIIDILTHVAVHGGYHRGQIAKVVRQCGGTPAVTDFIVFARHVLTDF